MNTGKLQRRWSEDCPQVYDKARRMVCLDIVKETRTEDDEEKEGYSYVSVQIDSLIDYGHVKSQLIEAAFAQKDEFGLVMNAVNGILSAASASDTWKAFKESVNADDINTFKDFCAWRDACAEAAKEVMKAY